MTIHPVVGYEGMYSVTEQGSVHNVKTGNVVRGTLYSRGYRMVCLSRMGEVERRTVHRIVAEAFIGPRPNGAQIDHIDGDKTNNAAANLRYCSPRENIRNSLRLGLHPTGQRNGQTKLTAEQVAEIRSAKSCGGRYWGAQALADKFGVSECQVRRRAAAIREQAKGD